MDACGLLYSGVEVQTSDIGQQVGTRLCICASVHLWSVHSGTNAT